MCVALSESGGDIKKQVGLNYRQAGYITGASEDEIKSQQAKYEELGPQNKLEKADYYPGSQYRKDRIKAGFQSWGGDAYNTEEGRQAEARITNYKDQGAEYNYDSYYDEDMKPIDITTPTPAPAPPTPQQAPPPPPEPPAQQQQPPPQAPLPARAYVPTPQAPQTSTQPAQPSPRNRVQADEPTNAPLLIPMATTESEGVVKKKKSKRRELTQRTSSQDLSTPSIGSAGLNIPT